MSKTITNGEFGLYLITWEDAEACSSWEEKDDANTWGDKRTIVTEIGWIYKETKHNICITSQLTQLTSDEDGGVIGNRSKIPKDMIMDKVKLDISKCIKTKRRKK